MSLTHRSAVKPLAAGLYAALNTTAFTGATTGTSPIFRSYVPEGQRPPYAVLQNFTENVSPDFAAMGSPAKDVTFQLHAVSQARGEAEACDVLDAGVGIVMRGWFGSTATVSVSVANHRLLLLEYEGSEGYEDLDDAGVETFHRIGRFRAQLEPST